MRTRDVIEYVPGFSHRTDRLIFLGLTIMLGLSIGTRAHAALEARGNGTMVYDTDRGITWLADAKLPASIQFGVSGIDSGGWMTWDTANAWIAAMNAANYLGFHSWRLPSALNSNGTGPCWDTEANPICGDGDSEPQHLFYSELGGSRNRRITESADPDVALFSNIETIIWLADESPITPTTHAMSFSFFRGGQAINSKGTMNGVWPVLDGDPAIVPEPASAVLVCLSLGFFGCVSRTWRMSQATGVLDNGGL
ncbi:MAG: hypothetical protein CO107_10840 [Deltaproteobacteria bacterium CG_4_9_14_3_um_filter_51_14]|nr:MAG: hypothetical protein CO107_10840 [Deltaproteobacteria bacterium CG_4_9_14_3_um_filter_51_14]